MLEDNSVVGYVCKDCLDKFLAGQTNEKALEKLVTEAVEKGTTELKALRQKLTESEGKLVASENAVLDAQKITAQIKATQLTNGLVKNQPKTIPITEAVAILEKLDCLCRWLSIAHLECRGNVKQFVQLSTVCKGGLHRFMLIFCGESKPRTNLVQKVLASCLPFHPILRLI